MCQLKAQGYHKCWMLHHSFHRVSVVLIYSDYDNDNNNNKENNDNINNRVEARGLWMYASPRERSLVKFHLS